MSADELPKEGERVTIRWPKGPYDFVMEFKYEDRNMLGLYPQWHWLHGVIVEPAEWHLRSWSLMVHLVDDEWTMIPMGGRISDVEP